MMALNTTSLLGVNSTFFEENVTHLVEITLVKPSQSRDLSNRIERVPTELRDPLYIVIPITVIYAFIFLTGVVGNVSTCFVVARNKFMHTATNYYLFSLAISDLLLLVSGLPPEMYRLWWPQVYIFGDTFCMVQSFSAETSANATVLTITAFTVERYIAICHPFLTHTMSKLSRAVKFVIAIWLFALCLAIPQAIQYGMYYAEDEQGGSVSRCTMTRLLVEHSFELSTLVFFVSPMTVITVLYVLIGMKLRRSRTLSAAGTRDEPHAYHRRSTRISAAQNRVIKMLVAVVVAFFVCWAPFHAQRLLAVHISNAYSAQRPPNSTVLNVYHVLDYVSGVLYFVSTTVNPLLYNIMSNKFREAFKSTLAQLCDRRHGHHSPRMRTYSTLSRYQTSLRHHPQQDHGVGEEAVAITQLTERPAGPANDSPETLIQLRNSSHQFKAPVGKLVALNGKKPRKFRGRCNSNSSQTTVLTSLSRSVNSDAVIRNSGRIKRNNRKYANKNNAIGLGTFKYKFRTFSIFKVESDDPPKCFVRHKSVDSANTISDSSLQDLDEIEFSSSDLVKYMEEVNHDIS